MGREAAMALHQSQTLGAKDALPITDSYEAPVVHGERPGMQHKVDIMTQVNLVLNQSSESGVESEKCLPPLSRGLDQLVA